MQNHPPTETAETTGATAPKTLSIKVFGVGNAGINVLDQIVPGGLPGAAFAAVNTDAQSLAASAAGEKLHLEAKLLRGLGSGGDPERGRAMAEEQLPRLKALCEGVDVVFIVAGLGGGTGSGISPVLARAAKEAGALALGFVFLPFDCEGDLRAQAARAGLDRLKEAADTVFCLPNQKALALIEAATSLTDTFKASNQLLGQCVRGSCLALASQTLMGLPFADLCASIRQRSTECGFAVAEAAGPERAKEVIERLLAHPMLNGPATLQHAQAVAVWILGGAGLAMVEVNGVMDQLHRHCQGAPLMMGAATTPLAGDLLLVGLLVARPEDEDEALPAPAAAAKTTPASRTSPSDMGVEFMDRAGAARPQSRFVPPPPEMSPEKMEQLRAKHAASTARGRKAPKLRQAQLSLEIVSKGRFDETEPTIHKGEDLDVPTYIRRGIALN